MRNYESLKINFTTLYEHIVEYVDQEESINLDIDDFEIGIPIEQVRTVNVFDFRVYNMFKEVDTRQTEFDFDR